MIAFFGEATLASLWYRSEDRPVAIGRCAVWISFNAFDLAAGTCAGCKPTTTSLRNFGAASLSSLGVDFRERASQAIVTRPSCRYQNRQPTSLREMARARSDTSELRARSETERVCEHTFSEIVSSSSLSVYLKRTRRTVVEVCLLRRARCFVLFCYLLLSSAVCAACLCMQLGLCEDFSTSWD